MLLDSLTHKLTSFTGEKSPRGGASAKIFGTPLDASLKEVFLFLYKQLQIAVPVTMEVIRLSYCCIFSN